jgi:hypothetical protein
MCDVIDTVIFNFYQNTKTFTMVDLTWTNPVDCPFLAPSDTASLCWSGNNVNRCQLLVSRLMLSNNFSLLENVRRGSMCDITN